MRSGMDTSSRAIRGHGAKVAGEMGDLFFCLVLYQGEKILTHLTQAIFPARYVVRRAVIRAEQAEQCVAGGKNRPARFCAQTAPAIALL